LVQEYFGSAAAVPIDGVAIEKLNFSKRRAEAAATTLGQERQNSPGKKGFAVCREFAGGKDSGIPSGLRIETPYDSLSFVSTILKLMGRPEPDLPGPVIQELVEPR